MGQLIVRDDTILGSELIGQRYTSSAYFQSRPSASGYSALPSAASNLGPTSEVLRSDINKRQAVEGANAPSDLLTTSGSGLDPDISPEAARFQIERIVQARALGQSQREELQAMVVSSVQHPLLGFIGKSRTNVLELNLALDAAFGRPPR
jgi:K+-transporting ATPase ATPase C chain